MTKKQIQEKKWLAIFVVLFALIAIYLFTTPRAALVGGNAVMTVPGITTTAEAVCEVTGQGTATLTIKCGNFPDRIAIAPDGRLTYTSIGAGLSQGGFIQYANLSGVQKLIVETAGNIDRIDLRSFKGKETEIHGGYGKDTIIGSNGKDIIYGEDGADHIEGLKDHDEIYGGEGKDTIDGGEGNDYIRGEEGNDTINGNEDNDFICGDAGIDILNGNTGIDYLYGGPDAVNADIETTLNAGGNAGDKAYGDKPYLPTQPQDAPSGCVPTTNCHVDGPTQVATANPCAIGAKPVHTVTVDQTWVPPTTGTGTNNPVTGTGTITISPEI